MYWLLLKMHLKLAFLWITFCSFVLFFYECLFSYILQINDSNLKYPSCLTNTPVGFSCAEFQSQVYPVLAALVAYHRHIGPCAQQKVTAAFSVLVVHA